jgi:hypothetical protein
MRTTTNYFKTKVQNHIIDRLGNTWDEVTETENENATTAERLQNVVNEFYRWYCPYEKRRNPNRGEAFKDFLQGLPGCLNAEFTYYAQRETLREWHEQTPEESERFTDEQVCNNYYYLVYREFVTLCKKNNIAF